MNIKSQFVSYEIAKKCKELGMDEECLAVYVEMGYNEFTWMLNWQLDELDNNTPIGKNLITKAVLYSQVESWLREKYNIHITIGWLDDVCGYYSIITTMDNNTEIFESKGNLDYQETRENAVLEVIKIIKKL